MISFLEKIGLIRRIFGNDAEGNWSPYLTHLYLTPKTRWGQLRLHVFHRGDADPDLHDHPSDFWTFPFLSYVEEVVEEPWTFHNDRVQKVVQAWRWHYRPAEYAHRVIGRYRGWDRGFDKPGYVHEPIAEKGPVVTLIWWKPRRRDWGFWVHGRWVPWKEYIYGK